MTGEIAVKIKEGFTPERVTMYHSQTLSTDRRDFRWMRQSNERTPACHWPWVKLPFHMELLGADCASPIIWHAEHLSEKDGVYSARPPEPTRGHWTGYYIEVRFEGDTEYTSALLENKFAFSTPGYTWPNTLPFSPCSSDDHSCLDQAV